ncbi:MAG TPA: hypothetical protein VF517_18175 [Thermoleophilaceae bacterium]
MDEHDLALDASLGEAVDFAQEQAADLATRAAALDSLARWLCAHAADLRDAQDPDGAVPPFLPFVVHEVVASAAEARAAAGRLHAVAPPEGSQAAQGLRGLTLRTPDDAG